MEPYQIPCKEEKGQIICYHSESIQGGSIQPKKLPLTPWQVLKSKLIQALIILMI